MAQGGMYDQIGGGFARYSVDEQWLVPHFEKMLYDNAQLAAASICTPGSSRGTRSIAERSSRRPSTGSMPRDAPRGRAVSTAAQDADSEGVEGKFYIWSADEVREDSRRRCADLYMQMYDITDGGNWEGQQHPAHQPPRLG